MILDIKSMSTKTELQLALDMIRRRNPQVEFSKWYGRRVVLIHGMGVYDEETGLKIRGVTCWRIESFNLCHLTIEWLVFAFPDAYSGAGILPQKLFADTPNIVKCIMRHSLQIDGMDKEERQEYEHYQRIGTAPL